MRGISRAEHHCTKLPFGERKASRPASFYYTKGQILKRRTTRVEHRCIHTPARIVTRPWNLYSCCLKLEPTSMLWIRQAIPLSTSPPQVVKIRSLSAQPYRQGVIRLSQTTKAKRHRNLQTGGTEKSPQNFEPDPSKSHRQSHDSAPHTNTTFQISAKENRQYLTSTSTQSSPEGANGEKTQARTLDLKHVI